MSSLNILIVIFLGVVVGISTSTIADDEYELFYSYYSDDTGLDVSSPSFFISKDLGDLTTLGFLYLHETYEKTPQDSGSGSDVVSGATTVVGGGGSKFEEDRDEYGVYATRRFDNTTLGASFYYGKEPDYDSKTFSLSADQELFDKNLTLSARLMVGMDEVDKLDAAANESFPKEKDVTRVVFAATQLLNRTTFLVGGFALEDQQGYLSSPTRRIVVETFFPGGGGVRTVYDERHPDERLREVYFVRAKKYLMTGSALDLNLSTYTDDWGVDAQSAEARISHYITPSLIGRLRYRYYTQSEADFYQEGYTTEQEIMTADNRLREYESKLYGIKLTYFLKDRMVNDMSISLAYDKFEESNNGLTADIVQIWLNSPF